MEDNVTILLFILSGILIIDGLILLFVLLEKVRRRRIFRKTTLFYEIVQKAILDRDIEGLKNLSQFHPYQFSSIVRKVLEQIEPDEEMISLVKQTFIESRAYRKAFQRCSSHLGMIRLRGYLSLSLAIKKNDISFLLNFFAKERNLFYRRVLLTTLVNNRELLQPDELIRVIDQLAIPLTDHDYTLLGMAVSVFETFFQDKDFQKTDYSDEIIRLYIIYSDQFPSESAWKALCKISLERDDAIGNLALTTLAKSYSPSLFLETFKHETDSRFLKPYGVLLGRVLTPNDIHQLDPWFEEDELFSAGMQALTELLNRYPDDTDIFLGALNTGSDSRGRALSLALSSKLKYVLYHSSPLLKAEVYTLITNLLKNGKTGIVLEAIETSLSSPSVTGLLPSLKDYLLVNEDAYNFIATHGNEAITRKLELRSVPKEEDHPRIPVKKSDKLFVAFLIFLAMMIFPITFSVRWNHGFGYLTFQELLYRFVFDFHYFFAWYTVAVNSIYLIILILSVIKLNIQSYLWESDLRQFLFSPKVLPKITILAPAFQEEETIVDSIESLLSIVYPDFQVVVVNDGSKDKTMKMLIEAFKLQPISPGDSNYLPSMPVTTVYNSPIIPNLIVLDKINGGKADALNAGLNYAEGEFVCCIDADSLLAPESLLRIMLQTLSQKNIPIAIGGNIVPVNGSVVEHGHLQKIGLPRHPLAAFQTIEYLRSFISGRLGWALMGGLLIISGAFGVFQKQKVIDAGGYMTGKGRFRKNTVGEDMELVVRLIRQEKDTGGNGSVDYCYNANCWTEVPENDAALGKQRDRWHRGLIEVLLHHRSMVFNPRYGVSGIVSMPYFYIFELIGPILEMIGYSILILSLVFSLINPIVSFLVFSVAIAFGVLISLSSILLAERQVVYFSIPDFFKLILIALWENFGFRQAMSMSRVLAFIQYFYKVKGWQKMSRKGFSRAKQ